MPLPRARFETVHRPIHGPLRPDAVAVVEHFYHCGDLAFGFTRHQCLNCPWKDAEGSETFWTKAKPKPAG